MPFDSDRTALIIGATRGLGFALADTAVEFHDIRSIGLGRSVSADIVMQSPASYMIRCDISKPETWNEALASITVYGPGFVVWNAGIFDPEKRPFVGQPDDLIDAMIDTHLRGPMKFLRRVHRLQMTDERPYHLIVVASTSWYRLRENESLYCGLKGFKHAFALNFHGELTRDLPGSKVLLVNPGGMKTDFLGQTGQDVSKMMDPFAVAEIVWREALAQTQSFGEINIIREPDGTPRLERGTMTPETPA